MSMPEQQTVHPFTVYAIQADGSKGRYVGGSYDNASAVSIMCSAFATRQFVSNEDDLLLEVFDSTDAPIAFIGNPLN
jgi:hypothetical protein